MFKSTIIVVALCLFVVAECKPTEQIGQSIQNAMNKAGQAVQDGIQAIGQGINHGLNKAQTAVNAGVGMASETVSAMTPTQGK